MIMKYKNILCMRISPKQKSKNQYVRHTITSTLV